MEKKNSGEIVFIFLIVLLIVDLAVNFYQMGSYYNQRDAGNERWHQVEERLVEMEDKIENFINEK